MLITNAAMIAFAAEPELCRVRAPALVLGGTTDPYYSEDLFRRTAAAIPGGRAVIFPGKGHLYPAASKAAANIALDSCSDGSQISTPQPRQKSASPAHDRGVGFPGRWA